MATSMLLDEEILEICDVFKIEALTETQKCSISAVKEGKDVFVSTRTGSGKSLTYECYPLIAPGKAVIVIAPLVTIMDEQCKKLNDIGFRATYIGLDSSQNELIDSGSFDFLFGSPESFLKDKKWRDMLKSSVYQKKLGLVVVDEAHTVVQWYAKI